MFTSLTTGSLKLKIALFRAAQFRPSRNRRFFSHYIPLHHLDRNHLLMTISPSKRRHSTNPRRPRNYRQACEWSLDCPSSLMRDFPPPIFMGGLLHQLPGRHGGPDWPTATANNMFLFPSVRSSRPASGSRNPARPHTRLMGTVRRPYFDRV